MIPYSRPKLSDLYTLSQSKLLENHSLHSGTDIPQTPTPPPPPTHRAYEITLRAPQHGIRSIE